MTTSDTDRLTAIRERALARLLDDTNIDNDMWDDVFRIITEPLLNRVATLEAENERLRERQESHDLANAAIEWKRVALDAEAQLAAAEKVIAEIREWRQGVLGETPKSDNPEPGGISGLTGEEAEAYWDAISASDDSGTGGDAS